MFGRRSRLGLTLVLLTAVLSVALAGAAQAAVTVSRAELSGDRLRIEGRAVANRPITVDGVQMGVSDSSGGFQIERSGYARPADCTVDVNDGAASPVNVRLSGCTATVPAPTAALSSVSLNPAIVAGGATGSATVTLIAAAPAGGALVSLTSSNTAAATVPATLTVPAGVTSATASVGTSAVGSTSTSVISATYIGATRTATLTVTGTAPPPPAGPPPTGFSLSHTSLDQVGNLSIGAVNFAPNPPTPLDFAVQSSHPNNAQVPASVHVTQFSDPGNPVASFTVNYATVVSAPTNVTISVSAGGVTKTAVLTLRPPPPPTLAPGERGPGFVGSDFTTFATLGTTIALGPDGVGPLRADIIAGRLPNGLSLAQPSCATPAKCPYVFIVGTPTTVQTSTFTVRGTDARGQQATGTFTIVINPAQTLAITPQQWAPLTVGSFGNLWIDGSGGIRPYTWVRTAGQLPPGMALIQDNPNGPSVRVGGTPTTAGTFNFTLRLTDGRGTTVSRSFMVTVS